MKPNLRHIESALKQAEGVSAASSISQFNPDRSKSRPFSFKVRPVTPSASSDTNSETVQPFASAKDLKLPALPKSKMARLGSHRPSSQPAVALDLLKEIEAKLTQWQTELQQVILNIQAIYIEGPIVDGWLETSTGNQSTPDITDLLRQGDTEALRAYVQQLETSGNQDSSATTYLFCRLDADGNLQSQTCPLDQLPSLSLAIARHQRLRLLLNQKDYLEVRLGRITTNLQVLQKQISDSP